MLAKDQKCLTHLRGVEEAILCLGKMAELGKLWNFKQVPLNQVTFSNFIAETSRGQLCFVY